MKNQPVGAHLVQGWWCWSVEVLLILHIHENTLNSLSEEDLTNEFKTMTQPVKQWSPLKIGCVTQKEAESSPNHMVLGCFRSFFNFRGVQVNPRFSTVQQLTWKAFLKDSGWFDMIPQGLCFRNQGGQGPYHLQMEVWGPYRWPYKWATGVVSPPKTLHKTAR